MLRSQCMVLRLELVGSDMSASRVGGSLMPAWATQAGMVPHRITSIKFLVHQKSYTSNEVWDIRYPKAKK